MSRSYTQAKQSRHTQVQQRAQEERAVAKAPTQPHRRWSFSALWGAPRSDRSHLTAPQAALLLSLPPRPCCRHSLGPLDTMLLPTPAPPHLLFTEGRGLFGASPHSPTLSHTPLTRFYPTQVKFGQLGGAPRGLQWPRSSGKPSALLECLGI